MRKNKNQLWIMKPKASSQGKGIQVISSFDEVPRGAGQPACLVQQYIHNPLLIDGYKWDLRIYVAITSINPLRIYVYEEGLTRFASEKYDTTDLKNVFSHLTNYSINKKHVTVAGNAYKNQLSQASIKPSTSSYTQKYNAANGKQNNSDDKTKGSAAENGPQNPFQRPGSNLDKRGEQESKSNVTKSKWTMKAFKEYLKNIKESGLARNLDVDHLFKKIHDIVVKTIISAEPLLWNGIEMYLPNTYQFDTSSNIDTKKKNNNCFELLGFDILIDEKFKPWLLEVNLSPSLNTDTQLDFKVKGSLIADLFNLVGLQNDEMQQSIKNQSPTGEAQNANGNGQGTSATNSASVGFGTSYQDSQST